MSVYVDANSRLHHDQERSLALNCPHCQVYSHITAVSVPQFSELVANRPSHVGVVYRCDSCNAPVFLRYAVKVYAANRVEFSNNFVELERAREKFNFTYLPEECEKLFREALACYSTGHFNAFASMCRRTAQSVFNELGENGRLRIFNQIAEARDMAEIDVDTYNVVKKVLFGNEGSGLSTSLLDAAGVHSTLPLAAGTESLNVAAAAAICLFEARRQRMQTKRPAQSGPSW